MCGWLLATCIGILGNSAVFTQRSPDASGLTVDFLAVDASGRPLLDLRHDEVVLKVGGQRVDLRSLRLVPAASDAISRASRDTPQTFGSAEALDFERTFVIVIDDESLPQGSEQSTRDAIAGFVRGLGVRDRVGLVVVPHGGGRVPLTTDHNQVAQAVRRLSGRASRNEAVTDAACRTQNVLRELNAVLSAAESPYGPVTLVFVSGSMYDGGGGVQAPLGTVMACTVQQADFRRFGPRGAQSRSYLYIVQPETFNSLQWNSSPRSGLEQLAGAMGGRILQLSGRDSDVLNRVLLETSAVYVAIVGLTNTPRSVQTLSVTTSRRGVKIVARPQISAAAGESGRR